MGVACGAPVPESDAPPPPQAAMPKTASTTAVQRSKQSTFGSRLTFFTPYGHNGFQGAEVIAICINQL
jgi:hypothetical protein